MIGGRDLRSKIASGGIAINMTPLIDCTFLLIIFFILTSQFASESLARLKLPQPLRSQALPAERMEPPGVIVNVVGAEGQEDRTDAALSGEQGVYKIEGRSIDLHDLVGLKEVLQRRRQAAGEGPFSVEIRADRRVRFGYVWPVMAAAAEVGIEKMRITALIEAGD